MRAFSLKRVRQQNSVQGTRFDDDEELLPVPAPLVRGGRIAGQAQGVNSTGCQQHRGPRTPV